MTNLTKEVRHIRAGDFHFVEIYPDSYLYAIPGGERWKQGKLISWIKSQGLLTNVEFKKYFPMEE